MEAQHETRCAACDETIYPGEEIVLNVDKEWVHEGCGDA